MKQRNFALYHGITSPPDLAEKLYTVTNWFSFMREEKMKGIRMDIVRIFLKMEFKRLLTLKIGQKKKSSL